MSLSGHVWTVGGLAVRGAVRTSPPPSIAWTTTLEDPVAGTVRLSGRFSRPPGARQLVILIHGLGGSSESRYMCETARVAQSLGLASLRLNLRGADHRGRDFYHGGLTADLRAAVADSALAGFERIACLGFSLGGHVALRFATEVEEPRFEAVACVCSPLDLGAGVRVLDGAPLGIYRRYLLRGLKAMHRRLDRSGALAGDSERAQRARTLREFDSATVVPRFGFRDADDYYRRASIGDAVRNLRLPVLSLVIENDPMVPAAAIRSRVGARTPPLLEIRWLRRGGHLALPRRIDLGFEAPRDWRTQTLKWLASRERGRSRAR